MDEIGFGQWLCRQRKSLGLTQKQLAERVNCATITVRKLEAEQRRPSLQVLERLAQVLNVPRAEQPAFFRFARGDTLSISALTVGDSPWQIIYSPLHPGLLNSIVAQIGQARTFPGLDGLSLDENLHLVEQIVPQAVIGTLQETQPYHDVASLSTESLFLLMLVPIKVPAELARQFFQNAHPHPGSRATG